MSYSPVTDFIGLLRSTAGGVRAERMPGLDYVITAISRIGLFKVSVSSTPPIANQSTTVWLLPASPSWVAEGSVFLWNAGTSEYELATPQLWSAFLSTATAGATPIIQDVVTNAANVNAATTILRVQNVGAPVTLTMPLSSAKVGAVLVSDWNNLAGTNNIVINRAGSDVFPNGATSLTIAGDGGSLLLRPVPGGYAL